MLKSYLKIGLLAAAMTAPTSDGVAAASLGLMTEPPVIATSDATVTYLEFFGDGDLSSFAAVIDFADGTMPDGTAFLDFGIGFELADPKMAGGGFSVFDDSGLFLGGDILDVGFVDDVIELQFGALTGAAAGDFGDSVLALIEFPPGFGMDPFAALTDGTDYTTAITILKVAPIPVPGALPLLALGLGGLAVPMRLSA